MKEITISEKGSSETSEEIKSKTNNPVEEKSHCSLIKISSSDTEKKALEVSDEERSENTKVICSKKSLSVFSDELESKIEHSEKISISDNEQALNDSQKRKSEFSDSEIHKRRKEEENEILICSSPEMLSDEKEDVRQDSSMNKTCIKVDDENEEEVQCVVREMLDSFMEETCSKKVDNVNEEKEVQCIVREMQDSSVNETCINVDDEEKEVQCISGSEISQKKDKKGNIECTSEREISQKEEDIECISKIETSQEEKAEQIQCTSNIEADLEEEKEREEIKCISTVKTGEKEESIKEEEEEIQCISEVETGQVLGKAKEYVKEKVECLLKFKSGLIVASKKDLDKAAFSIFQEFLEDQYGDQLEKAKKKLIQLTECRKTLEKSLEHYHSELVDGRVLQRKAFESMNYTKPIKRNVGVSVNHQVKSYPTKKEPSVVSKIEVSANVKSTNLPDAHGRRSVLYLPLDPVVHGRLKEPSSSIKSPVAPKSESSTSFPQARPTKEKLFPTQTYQAIRPNVKHDAPIPPSKIPPPNVIKCGDRLIPYLPVPNKQAPFRPNNLPVEKKIIGAAIAPAGMMKDVVPRPQAILQGTNVLVPLEKFLQMLPNVSNRPVIIRQAPPQMMTSNAIRYAMPVQGTTIRGQLPSSQPQTTQPMMLHKTTVSSAVANSLRNPAGTTMTAVRGVTPGGSVSWSYRSDVRKVMPHNLPPNNTAMSVRPSSTATMSVRPSSSSFQSTVSQPHQSGSFMQESTSALPKMPSTVSISMPSKDTNSSKLSVPPLPSSPSYDDVGVKPVPPKPFLKANKKEDGKGICLVWNLPLTKKHAAIACYQMFSCIDSQGWRKTGDVKALVLPMACTLQNFQSNTTYHFVIRAVDTFQRFGPFSDPVSVKF